MELQKSLSNNESINTNEIPYSKINTQEDIFLETKEISSHQSNLEYNDNNFNNNNIENYNNDFVNNTKSNQRQTPGILNRKLSKYFYMRLGNTFTFFGDNDGSPLIVIGPHWPMYICFCSSICIGFAFFFYYFWDSMYFSLKIIGIFIFLTFVFSYTMTFLVNPGIPKYDENAIMGQPREKYRFCDACKIWINMDKNTAHCFDCNVCVEGYDHHCPWTGKCIGKKNLNYFYTFLISILLVFAFFVVSLTQVQNAALIEKKKNKNKNKTIHNI
jgi:hypothetical protein